MERMSNTAGEVLSIIPNAEILETPGHLSTETPHAGIKELVENPEEGTPNVDAKEIGAEEGFWQSVVASTDEIAALLGEISEEKLEMIGHEPLELIDIPISDEMINSVRPSTVKQKILDSLENF